MSGALLSVRDLRVRYLSDRGVTTAVDGVSFDVMPGEIFGLAGESGSGKSTIAQAILRILAPPAVITGGSIRFGGRFGVAEDVLDMSAERLRAFRWRRISLVFQSAMNALNPVLTIGEQISDVIEAHEGATRRAALARAAGLLELVGLGAEHLGRYPHQLSGGMRQRVGVAIALALRPELVIMDEPTTALDVVVQRELLARILELQRELGFSILLITHDLALLFELSTRIGVLYAGRLVETAPAQTLRRAPLHPYTRGLVAAFPSVRGPRRPLVEIRGAPPDLRAPPPGCHFHPRCAAALAPCSVREPALSAAAPGHHVACHLCPGQEGDHAA